jgi:hypothetical protein
MSDYQFFFLIIESIICTMREWELIQELILFWISIIQWKLLLFKHNKVAIFITITLLILFLNLPFHSLLWFMCDWWEWNYHERSKTRSLGPIELNNYRCFTLGVVLKLLDICVHPLREDAVRYSRRLLPRKCFLAFVCHLRLSKINY